MNGTPLPASRLPEHIAARLTLPLIAAPMLRVSGTDLVTACCNAGIIGSFPTVNARTTEQLSEWVQTIRAGVTPEAAPCAACLLAAADLTAARGRLVASDLVPTGRVATTLLQHARRLAPSWAGQPRAVLEEGVGPETWIEEIAIAVNAAHGSAD